MNPRVRVAVRWALGIALLVVLLSWFDFASVKGRLASLDLRLAVPAILGLVAVHLVAALSWRRLTEHLTGLRIDWRTTVRLYYAAQAWGAITTANLGADVFRVASVDPGPGRARSARPVAIQRLASVGALVVMGILGALALPIAGLRQFVLALLGIGAAVGAGIVLLSRGSALLHGPLRGLAGRFGVDIGHAPAGPGLGVALRDGLGLALVFHGLSLLLGLVLVAAVDPSAVGRPLEVLGALAVARLSLAVPLSPNGIGLQEGALTILFVQLGLGPDVALAAALLNRLALLLTAAIGSLVLLAGPRAGAPAAFGTRPRAADG